MSTTGLSNFNLDMNELIEEAFERCGKQLRSGYDFRTARRSVNILTIEWANRGINLWTVEQAQIVLNTGQAIYPLPVDTIDILDAVTRQYNGMQQNQIDINLSRISESTYSTIPNKNATGRPIQMYVNRQSGNVADIPQTTLATGYPISATDTTITLVMQLWQMSMLIIFLALTFGQPQTHQEISTHLYTIECAGCKMPAMEQILKISPSDGFPLWLLD